MVCASEQAVIIDAEIYPAALAEFARLHAYRATAQDKLKIENLIFGTMELRIIYFPNTIERNRSFKVSFRSNIRFRFVSRYVKPPNTIQLNSGDEYTF